MSSENICVRFTAASMQEGELCMGTASCKILCCEAYDVRHMLVDGSAGGVCGLSMHDCSEARGVYIGKWWRSLSDRPVTVNSAAESAAENKEVGEECMEDWLGE